MEIRQIVELAGGAANLARDLKVHHTAIIGWRKTGQIPVVRAQQIHRLTGIPLSEIRPDVWNNSEQAA